MRKILCIVLGKLLTSYSVLWYKGLSIVSATSRFASLPRGLQRLRLSVLVFTAIGFPFSGFTAFSLWIYSDSNFPSLDLQQLECFYFGFTIIGASLPLVLQRLQLSFLGITAIRASLLRVYSDMSVSTSGLLRFELSYLKFTIDCSFSTLGLQRMASILRGSQ